MTEEQAAEDNTVSNWLSSLVAKMETVFEENKEGGRPHLVNKWNKLSTKFVTKYDALVDAGCTFAASWDDDSVDFDSVNTCRVSCC